MRMRWNWSLISLVSLAMVGQANANEEESGPIVVDPNQVVVQVYGIV